MEINIIIVHYNSSDTIHCLESLALQTVKANVILVNNASTDHSMDSIRFIAKKINLTIQIIDSPINGGFAAGNNIALRWAHQNTPKAWNLLLNNDTLLPTDFLETLTDVVEELSHTYTTPFALSTIEYDFSKQHRRHTGKQYMSIPTGLCFSTKGILRTPYLCGACILIDPQAPLLDEGYFLYYEDTDYSKRLQEVGYLLLTTDKTQYYHKKGGSTYQKSNIISIQMTSMWRYYKKYYPRWMYIVKVVRKIENLLRGRIEIIHIIEQTYKQANAKQ